LADIWSEKMDEQTKELVAMGAAAAALRAASAVMRLEIEQKQCYFGKEIS